MIWTGKDVNEAGERAGDKSKHGSLIVNSQPPTSNSQTLPRRTWKLGIEVRSWQLGVGSLELEVGSWELFRSRPNCAVETNHFAIEHLVFEDVTHERREFLRPAEARWKRNLLRK